MDGRDNAHLRNEHHVLVHFRKVREYFEKPVPLKLVQYTVHASLAGCCAATMTHNRNVTEVAAIADGVVEVVNIV